MKRHGLPRPAAASGASAEADAWANLRLALDEDMDRERLASDFHVVHDENYYNRLQHSAKSHRSVDSVLGSKHSLSLSNAPLRVNVGRRDEKAWYNVARRTRLPAGALASFIQPWMGKKVLSYKRAEELIRASAFFSLQKQFLLFMYVHTSHPTDPRSEGTIPSRSRTSSISRHRQIRLIRFSNTNGTW